MRKITLFLFSLLLAGGVLAQEQALRIGSPSSDKEIIIKENKRIKIMTADGKKISGRFHIAGNNAITIKDQTIALSDLESIKRNPLFLSLFSSGFLIYAGALTAGMGAIIGIFVETSGFLLIIPGAAMIYAGIKSPNVLKNYKAKARKIYPLSSPLPGSLTGGEGPDRRKSGSRV